MWNERKPWWQKKSKENQTDKSHYKDWCVIKVVGSVAYIGGKLCFQTHYKACAKLNAPSALFVGDKRVSQVEVDNLTKHEAHCVAKGLNFLDEGAWHDSK